MANPKKPQAPDWVFTIILNKLVKNPITIHWLGFTITILAKEDSK